MMSELCKDLCDICVHTGFICGSGIQEETFCSVGFFEYCVKETSLYVLMNSWLKFWSLHLQKVSFKRVLVEERKRETELWVTFVQRKLNGHFHLESDS